MRSFLLSKKTSFAALLLALAVSVADNFGYTHAVSRIPGQLGLGSDGSDGYISYANLITTRNHYETVKASYEAQESKLKGVELLDKADELRIAQREFNAAKTAFLTEFVKRSSTAKIDPLNVRIGLQFAVNGKLLPVEDSKENHRPIVQPMDDDNVTALVKR